MFIFDYVQPVQWWAYIVIAVFILVLMIAWIVKDQESYELKEHWKGAERLKGEIMGESYDLVSFSGGKNYYRVSKYGVKLEPAPADLVAMVKAHKAAEGMGLDPTKLEALGPIFTRKAPLTVDIDGDGKPAMERTQSSFDQMLLP